jgi:hypothetical protein
VGFGISHPAPTSPSQKAIFDIGHEVGLLATDLYSSGFYVSEDYLHHPEAQKTTESAISGSRWFLETGVRGSTAHI